MILRKFLSVLLAILIGFGPTLANAQQFSLSQLPTPDAIIGLSNTFEPVLVKGLVVFPQEPLKFRFIVDSGHDKTADDRIKEESERMVKYFLAAVTVPEKDQWVNLSPVEHDRMIADSLGTTSLGRDMLAQDYVLKQFASSMLNPDSEVGREFWSRVYQQAYAKFGSTEVPVDAFNKVWIMPDTAEVFEHNNAVYVTKAHLKVMLDSDYLAQAKGQENKDALSVANQTDDLAKQMMREVIVPAIEKEVNTGAHFAIIRQIYYAGILARWYRDMIKDSLMASFYMDKEKTNGVDVDDKTIKEQIYQRYMEAYKKGVVNFIREENNPVTGEVIPRKYFSGGIPRVMPDKGAILKKTDASEVVKTGKVSVVDFAAVTKEDEILARLDVIAAEEDRLNRQFGSDAKNAKHLQSRIAALEAEAEQLLLMNTFDSSMAQDLKALERLEEQLLVLEDDLAFERERQANNPVDSEETDRFLGMTLIETLQDRIERVKSRIEGKLAAVKSVSFQQAKKRVTDIVERIPEDVNQKQNLIRRIKNIKEKDLLLELIEESVDVLNSQFKGVVEPLLVDELDQLRIEMLASDAAQVMTTITLDEWLLKLTRGLLTEEDFFEQLKQKGAESIYFSSRQVSDYSGMIRQFQKALIRYRHFLNHESTLPLLMNREQLQKTEKRIAEVNQDLFKYEQAQRLGGIDIKNIDVARTGIVEAVRFDEEALKELVNKGFDGLTPVFLGIMSLDNPLTAMGVK